MLRRLCYVAFSLLLVLMSTQPGQADEVTGAMRKADVRLQTRVTLRSPHILIGELLERLSRQSGVTLAADDDSLAGGDAVAVSLQDVPLADAMDALWSVFSYRHAEWDWRRSAVKGEKGKFVYTLARPDYARFQAERLKQQVQTDFEAQAQELLAAADMPPDQLKEAAKQNFLLNSMVVDGTVRPGMRVLDSLPPGALLALLRGGPPISMPVSELAPQAQKALQEARSWQAAVFARDHVPEEMIKKSLPEPAQIGIAVSRSSDQIAPGLYIDTGRGSGDYFGGGYMEKPWRQKMNAEWMQPKDSVDDPASARTLATPRQPPVADGRHALADYLLRASDAGKVPMIARLPQSLDTGTSEAMLPQMHAAKTIQALLEAAEKEPINLQHKWRGGVLLLTCQNWFMDESEDTRLPWAEVKRLRDAEAAGDGFLSLGELAHAAAVLNEGQMKSLSEWFPVMAGAVEWHDFLAFYDKTPEYRPRVLSRKGDDFQYPESLVNAQLSIEVTRLAHPNLRLQIQESRRQEDGPPTHLILFVTRSDDGLKPINAHGFGYAAREYQTHLKVAEGAQAGGSKTSAAK